MSALLTVDLLAGSHAIRSLRLAVQDTALSRREHEFDSRRERHCLSMTYGIRAVVEPPSIFIRAR